MNFNLVEILTHPALMLLIIIGLDLIFGDPVYSFHPVRILGGLISIYETALRHQGLNGKFGGVLLSLLFLFCKSLIISFKVFSDHSST